MNSRFKISKEKKEELIKAIKEFFRRERDEEIGDLAALLILDFFIADLAPAFYNQGLQDCIAFMKDKLDDVYGLEI